MDEDEPGVTPFLGIYADVNMRERAVQRQPPSFCVNPADVMANPSDEFSPSTRISLSPGLRSSVSVRSNISSTAAGISSSRAETFINRQLSHTPDFTADFPDESLVSNAFSEEAFSAIVSVLQSCVKQEEPTTALTEGIPPSGENIKPLEPVAPRPVYPHHFSAYSSNNLGAHHPSVVCESTEACTPFPGLRMPLADLPLHHFQQLQNTSYDALAPLGIPRANASVAVPPMSPVLNAHAGIELDDLRQRAADYRARHPNSELDRAFLQCFAGRLSARGELLEEYRCYVVGCGQRNKRRDHILVHVGSHVEHRPWACQHCGMRFLRKNECKRHESSHEGRKPFSCSICAPTQERNFVRQDLLRRHMRVTHGFQEARTSASKKRLEAKNAKDENAEYWP
ncbi:hypothetical protein C8Q78DRAFT_961788 [Trametes maxima]|nr:hypothetical protein C8Q78DRAFT_961788 [Trametes maxima]